MNDAAIWLAVIALVLSVAVLLEALFTGKVAALVRFVREYIPRKVTEPRARAMHPCNGEARVRPPLRVDVNDAGRWEVL